MHFSMTSLMNSFNQLVSSADQVAMEPEVRKMGSLQDHLMSISRPSTEKVSSSANELSVGPPPMYRKESTSNVVGMPKRKGARLIVWSQAPSSNQAA